MGSGQRSRGVVPGRFGKVTIGADVVEALRATASDKPAPARRGRPPQDRRNLTSDSIPHATAPLDRAALSEIYGDTDEQLTEDFVMSSPQRLDQPGALTISSVLQPVATPGRLRSTPDPSGDGDRHSPIRRHPVVDARPPTAELRPSRGRRSNRCETNVRDSPPGASRFTHASR
jgi:hypothetical protein